MYHGFFGIDEQAFSISVNPRYLFMSAQHREALAHLSYGVSSGGFVMLTGEVGTGKTTLIRCLLDRLPEDTDVAMVINPAASAHELLCAICDEFNLAYHSGASRLKDLHDTLLAFLLHNHQKGRKAIVLIDEAQLLQVSTLEQVRLLTNIESDTHKLLQIILVGQPELNDLLARPVLRQLSQRITARYHLRPLSEKETLDYIYHRLTIAGLKSGSSVFSAAAAKRIASISGGIPRLINVLCDRMLLGAYSQQQKHVDLKIVKQAAQEVLVGADGHGSSHSSLLSSKNVALAAILVSVLCVSVTSWVLWRFSEQVPVMQEGQIALLQPGTLEAEPEASSIGKESESHSVTGSEEEKRNSLPSTSPLASERAFWSVSKNVALNDLLVTIGVAPGDELPPCQHAMDLGFQCETMTASTWTGLAELNRPVVLHLKTPARFAVYTTLLGFNEHSATLVRSGNKYSIALEKLSQMWTGEYSFAWRKPEGYSSPLNWGAKGETIRWLASSFAKIDRQEQLLTKNEYNSSLSSRIKIFQGEYGLKQDGIVGLHTLLRLNEALNRDVTLVERPGSPSSMTGEH